MSRPHLGIHRHRRWRWLFVLLVPIALYAVIAERNSWRPKTLPVIQPLGGLAWTPDGRSLLVNTDKEVQIWDTQKMLMRRSFKANVQDMRFTPSGLLACAVNGRPTDVCHLAVDLWDWEGGKRVLAPDIRYPLAFSPDGRQLIDSHDGGDGIDIKSYNARSGRLLKILHVKPPKGTEIRPLAPGNGGTCGGPPAASWMVSNDGKKGALLLYKKANRKVFIGFVGAMAYPTVEEGILLFDAQTGKHLAHLPVASLPKGVSLDYSIGRFSDDGRTFIISGRGSCQLRDAQTGRLLLALHDQRIFPWWNWTKRSGDFPWLVGFDTDGGQSVFIWNDLSGKLLREIKVNAGIINIAFSPDNRTLAVTTGSAVKLYRMK